MPARLQFVAFASLASIATFPFFSCVGSAGSDLFGSGSREASVDNAPVPAIDAGSKGATDAAALDAGGDGDGDGDGGGAATSGGSDAALQNIDASAGPPGDAGTPSLGADSSAPADGGSPPPHPGSQDGGSDPGSVGSVGVKCEGVPGGSCSLPAEICCRKDEGGGYYLYSCTAPGACDVGVGGALEIPCDDARGCGAYVCCATYEQRTTTDIACRPVGECKPQNARTIVCDPRSASACPNGGSCRLSTFTLPGYFICM